MSMQHAERTASAAVRAGFLSEATARRIETAILPLAALLAGMIAFSIFLAFLGKPPLDFYLLVYKAGFGTAFSWTNTLARAAPLLLAALCVALPARLGLVIIGGEGAIVLGGVAAGAVATLMPGLPGPAGILLMALAGALVGGLWIGGVGALRHLRGVNETIASLLMAYVAIALMNHLVEGLLRDPASLNKPSTAPLPAAWRIGEIPGLGVHWGLAVGILGCILSWVLIERTTWGFAARIVGGNLRAARIQGLPAGRLVIGFTALGGAFAGLAGMFEVAAVHGSANASLAAGYGYTGILIAFLARHNGLAIVPAAILLAGLEASSGLIQRRMALPDATVLVLEGMVFIAILLSDTFQDRLKFLSFLERRQK
ncbi:ABC transporter permease [Rhizobium rhizosphaerae]|uniref:ABC transporter permease n=1 Tax=Xaviernesmea rhizosphaerae TaxID=1672749 RepID=A0A1Q9ANQ9_9HYPH|nr:ABC transporter permease [Xaviernesmea rhizosphaerae]OLP57045.1 ABC transporter permease [Xaviernesmea rhizosphaerae]OQP87110.1 ABC transporter permease [Xaviernesmea rhizosphaerae]